MTVHLPPADAAVIRGALLAWRADGVARPLIPIYGGVDVDGDGEADFYGLGENDELVVVSGATLADSVAESDGTGFEGGDDE